VLLGRLLFRTGRPEEGIEELRRAVAGAPGNIAYRRDLAAMLDSSGRSDEVEEVMLDFTRALPDDPRSWNELGSLRLKRRDFEGAEEAFRRAAKVDPGNAAAHTNLGGLMIIKQDYEAAEEEYRAAVAAAPDLDEARLGLARAVLFDGREAEGRKLLEEFAASHPADSRVHSYWGLYLSRVKKDKANAREAFVRALELNPRDRIAIQELAVSEVE
jgi:Flp pilus assembly protein TadD